MMFLFWLILGVITILAGVFYSQFLRLLGMKPKSESMATPNLKQSATMIEQLARWLMITLGAGFLVQGLSGVLPGDTSNQISFLLLGLFGLMFLAIVGLTLANWKAK